MKICGGGGQVDIPEGIAAILAALSRAGHGAYLVGGCVRDGLLGRPVHDWDITTDARPDEILAAFEKAVPTGGRHGTVTVFCGGESAEVTPFRTESGYSDHRRPDDVRFVDSLEQDLARRDFTINAMAMDASGRVTDLFGGRDDLARGRIRCVGEPERRFSEDALRLLRALRFSAQLGFEVESGTMAAVRACAMYAAALSAERVRDETEKTLLSPRPGALSGMAALGLLAAVGIAALPGAERLGAVPPERALRWAALAAICPEADGAKLRLPRDICRAMRAASELGTAPRGDAERKDVLARYGETAVRAVCCLDGTEAELECVIKSGACIYPRELAVTGRDIPQTGAAAGRCLAALLSHVHRHPEDNRRGILLEIAEKWEDG